MISKGYHYVINLGIFSNFYISIDISIDLVYPVSLARDLLEQVNWESGFSLLRRCSSPLSTMSFHRAYWNSIYKVFVFYFHDSFLFYPQYNLSLQTLFCCHFPHFCYAYNFVVLQKITPKPAVLWCYTMKWHKQRTRIRGDNLKRHKPPFWISVNLSDTFKIQMKQKKHSFCMTISRRQKNGAQSIIYCMVYLIMVDMSFS